MTIEITSITILKRRQGTDIIWLHTPSLPSATYPFVGYEQLRFEAAAGSGEDYVKHHLSNIPYKLIEEGK